MRGKIWWQTKTYKSFEWFQNTYKSKIARNCMFDTTFDSNISMETINSFDILGKSQYTTCRINAVSQQNKFISLLYYCLIVHVQAI